MLPLVEFVLEKFGAFDFVPSPDDDELWGAQEDWEGAYMDGYKLPESLAGEGERANELRAAKKEGRLAKVDIGLKAINSELGETEEYQAYKHKGTPDERQTRITETLAFLHSRGG